MKSNIEWKQWGEIDPLWGVASWSDKAKKDAHPWEDADFYALGKSDWLDFRKSWDQYGVDRGTCLEIGCGAGRITRQLATDFAFVKALDVSQGMINYARRNIPDTNVEFHLSDGDHVPAPDSSLDAVFSTHVFQHFDDLDAASKYFREIFRCLKKNGSLMIHLPIYRWPSHRRLHRILSTLLRQTSNIRASYLRFLIKRGKWQPLMRDLSYELDWLYNTFDQIGYGDVEIRIVRTTSNGGPHPFILARKPAGA